MPTWSPATWDDFTAPGVIMFVAIALTVAYWRGWIIPRSHHVEIVGAKDREIAALEKRMEKADERSAKDAETMHLQANTIASVSIATQLQAHVLEAIRDAAASTKGGT